MPKGGKGKGGKNRRKGKGDRDAQKRELVQKDPEGGQEYGQVLKMLGNARLEVSCVDGVKRLCHIRGKMRKRAWVQVGDVVLVSLRDFQDEKGDVILKYTADEARQLKALKKLPENFKINETDLMQGEDDYSSDGIEFGDEEEREEINLDDI